MDDAVVSPSPQPSRAQMVAGVKASEPFMRELSARRVIARERAAGSRATRTKVEAERAVLATATTQDLDAAVEAFIDDELARYQRDGRAEASGDDATSRMRRIELAGRNITTWRPDTCGCRVRFSVDPLTWEHTHETCADHTASGQDLYDAIYDEATRKNIALEVVEATIDAAARAATVWSFDDASRLPGTDARVLLVAVPGANNQERNAIQAALDVQFGAGAAVVS